MPKSAFQKCYDDWKTVGICVSPPVVIFDGDMNKYWRIINRLCFIESVSFTFEQKIYYKVHNWNIIVKFV